MFVGKIPNFSNIYKIPKFHVFSLNIIHIRLVFQKTFHCNIFAAFCRIMRPNNILATSIEASLIPSSKVRAPYFFIQNVKWIQISISGKNFKCDP
ncbi:LOW QUALITY PROTEIN: hypothetical protein HZS_7306 [Henneguya salminicola]|nr:LOW QUALITY PROTEIN: hypothetical protein HZS_7306 [Henneguya salminicola]